MSDDPFSLDESDAGPPRTRVRPLPLTDKLDGRQEIGGGNQRAEASHDLADPTGLSASRNPYLAGFAPLLALAPTLESTAAPDDIVVFRARVRASLESCEKMAIERGAPREAAPSAGWFVAALIDDLAINTPWGGESVWPAQPLVSELYGDVDAGERFFERMDRLEQNPERAHDLLELGWCCLMLGFRGRHRVEGHNGSARLAERRARLTRLMRKRHQSLSLSPHWEGIDAPDNPRRFAIPIWSIGVITAALVFCIWLVLSNLLAREAQSLAQMARLLPPAERVALQRPERNSAPVSQPVEDLIDEAPLEVTGFELLPIIAAELPEPLLGAVRQAEDINRAQLSIQAVNPEVFRSARADLTPSYVPLITTLAEVLIEHEALISKVTIIGHTDSIPVSNSNPFQSNLGLSKARADTIRDILIEAGVDPDLLVSEGMGSTDPVAENDTSQGRARNRRVEIFISKEV